MDEKRRQKIIDDHPLLFKNLKYFECQDGWLDIIEQLAGDLEVLIKEYMKKDSFDLDFQPMATEIKEKYGGLRIYMTSVTDSMQCLIDAAENASKHICEVCGKPGKIRRFHHIQTLCDYHADS